MASLLTIPKSLHKTYIDNNALAGNVSGYKYWSFRNIASKIDSLQTKAGNAASTVSNAVSSVLNSESKTGANLLAMTKNSASLKSLKNTTSKLANLAKTTAKNGVYYPFSDTFVDFITKSSALDESQSTIENFYDNIPIVTVRAFVPETILGFFTSIFGNIAHNFTTVTSDNGFSNIANNLKSLWKKISENTDKIAESFGNITELEEFAKKLTDNINLVDSFTDVLVEGVNKITYNVTSGSFGNSIGSADPLFIKLPYLLYYKILGAETNNIYEFPAILNNIFKSNSYGWSNGRPSNAGSNENGIMGLWANTIGTTITPIFDPLHSSSDDLVGFTINLDLINDTLEHAINNYNLVQSLILYNMWVQYGTIQGPGSLYDVKIAGGQRFLMCSANISVTNKGMLRKVKSGDTWKPWGNETRIPDVYSITMDFRSLLPNNLNNYMISIYVGNSTVFPGDPEKSMAGELNKLIDDAINALISGSKSNGGNTGTNTKSS